MDWRLTDKNLKRYPHFDSEISASDAEMLVKDPARVARHPFYPFIFYEQKWNKWAPKGVQGDTKTRPIRYAARRDAYIFSYYRSLLAKNYESVLLSEGLQHSVLAYRKIIGPDGRGQCNIDFAKLAFDSIKRLRNCVVIALDVSGFFESLNHQKIKSDWCALLGEQRLPVDHFRVYNAITKYSYMQRDALYEKLGFLGPKINPKNGSVKIGYLIPFNDMPKRQICRPEALRSILKLKPSILTVNNNDYGIPQGAPISDLLANLYMLQFDKQIKEYVEQLGGVYLRYSDDILMVLPGGEEAGQQAKDMAIQALASCAPGLKFKLEKTYIYSYRPLDSERLQFQRLLGPKNQGANGLEYLGFRFDGRSIFIRDSTLSNLWRKVTRSANRHAIHVVKRYRDKSREELHNLLNTESFIKKFGRVEDFFDGQDDVANWTFWTYVKRCETVFGDDRNGIKAQLRAHRRLIHSKLHGALDYYYNRVKY